MSVFEFGKGNGRGKESEDAGFFGSLLFMVLSWTLLTLGALDLLLIVSCMDVFGRLGIIIHWCRVWLRHWIYSLTDES